MFLESIAATQGVLRNTSYHLARMKYSAGLEGIDLQALYHEIAPDIESNAYYKFRVIYCKDGIISKEIIPYIICPIKELYLRTIPENLDYSLKYLDRRALDDYTKGLPEGAIPLFVKNRYITDTSYTNVCFRHKGEIWQTPSTPLLKGTMRQSLIDTGEIEVCHITLDDLRSFDEVALINAMIPLGEVVLPIAYLNFSIFEAE